MNFVYVSVEALLLAVNRWQDIAGSFVCCSRTIHTHSHTHTHSRGQQNTLRVFRGQKVSLLCCD